MPVEHVMKRQRPVTCPTYPGHALTAYCLTCRQAACEQCVATRHAACEGCVPLGESHGQQGGGHGRDRHPSAGTAGLRQLVCRLWRLSGGGWALVVVVVVVVVVAVMHVCMKWWWWWWWWW